MLEGERSRMVHTGFEGRMILGRINDSSALFEVKLVAFTKVVDERL